MSEQPEVSRASVEKIDGSRVPEEWITLKSRSRRHRSSRWFEEEEIDGSQILSCIIGILMIFALACAAGATLIIRVRGGW
ncbi:MAG: hypothetical protein HYZ61_01540 [Candidatus Andersenbacteria bacterium]|nr:hypothetical protein [Candidatus Andersenbacteria bacterium]